MIVLSKRLGTERVSRGGHWQFCDS